MVAERGPVAPSIADAIVPYPDQALFVALRHAGQEAAMQVLWIYEHPIDLDGVARFCDYFRQGLLARRIEPSSLPFGRHRWVAVPGREDNVTHAADPRPRDRLYEWADEQVALPLDPEAGPGWRLGVQPLTDGSTAVSLVVSHCIADGGAVVIALREAVLGVRRDLGYPPPASRTRGRAVFADLRQTLRDIPEVGRTLRRAATVAYRRRSEMFGKTPAAQGPAPTGSSDAAVASVPSASIFISVDSWDARAAELGGNSFSLVAGFAARLAQHLGRTRAEDGAVVLKLPVSEREDVEDTRGNAVSIASVAVDPRPVAEDLSQARAAIRAGLQEARAHPDEMIELLPLLPFLPKKAFVTMADMAFGFSADLPVSVSNMGDMPAELLRVDGTDAEYFAFRGIDRQASSDVLDRRRGLLTVTSGRIGGKLLMTVISYQPGADNSQGRLREVIADTLKEFHLTGEIA